MAKKFAFSPDDFNQFNVLKIPFSIYLMLIYLNKYFLLVVLPALTLGSLDLSAIAKWFRIDLLMMTSCFPALVVLIVSLYRMPAHIKWAKTWWEKSRNLLMISSAMDLLILSSYIVLEKRLLDIGLAILLAINIGIIVYLMKSEYLKEMFKEFPEEIEKKK